MTRWEYMSLEVGGSFTGDFKKGDLQRMNELGAEGWEAIGVYSNDRAGAFQKGGAVFFKRELLPEE